MLLLFILLLSYQLNSRMTCGVEGYTASRRGNMFTYAACCCSPNCMTSSFYINCRQYGLLYDCHINCYGVINIRNNSGSITTTCDNCGNCSFGNTDSNSIPIDNQSSPWVACV